MRGGPVRENKSRPRVEAGDAQRQIRRRRQAACVAAGMKSVVSAGLRPNRRSAARVLVGHPSAGRIPCWRPRTTDSPVARATARFSSFWVIASSPAVSESQKKRPPQGRGGRVKDTQPPRKRVQKRGCEARQGSTASGLRSSGPQRRAPDFAGQTVPESDRQLVTDRRSSGRYQSARRGRLGES